jgi:hypothetical protein
MTEAFLAIQRTITLYGQYLDDLRMQEWGALFTADAVWAMPGAVFEGRQAIIEGVRAMEPDRPGLVKHLAYTPTIRFDAENRVHAWTDLLFLTRETFDAPWNIGVAGRYCDELVHIGTGWQFRLRVADLAPHEPPPVPCERGPG